MRILHCIETVKSGGVERRRLSLIRSLRSPEYEHIIVCAKAEGPIATAIRDEGVELVEIGSVKSVFSPGRYLATAKIVERWKPDIIHGAVIDGYVLSCVVGAWKRVPTIVMEETSDPRNRRWKGHLLAALISRFAHRAIAVSPSVAAYLKRLKVPEQKIVLINNGVGEPGKVSEDIKKETKREWGIGSEDLVIGSVGRMHDETHKRFGDLIRAFACISVERDTRLLLVGDGKERVGLETLARKLGVADRVIFAGYQFELDRFYAVMDVFALASQREAFGLVNAEAMRRGLPVIATAVGGVPYIVRANETGILIPPRDTKRMKEALEKLLASKGMRDRMGAKGKAIADMEYSEQRYVSDVARLYRSTVSAG